MRLLTRMYVWDVKKAGTKVVAQIPYLSHMSDTIVEEHEEFAEV